MFRDDGFHVLWGIMLYYKVLWVPCTMGYYDALCGTMGSYGVLWDTMGYVLWGSGDFGVLWCTMGPYAVLRATMGYHEVS